VLALAALLGGVGCATPTQAFAVTAVPGPAEANDSDLYAATVRVLSDRDYTLSVNDPVAGVVQTRFVEAGRSATGNPIYQSWHAVVEQGSLRLTIDCEEREPEGNFYCDEGVRSADWVAAAPNLRAEIFDAAARRAAYRKTHGSNAVAGAAPAAPAPAVPAPAAPAATPK
jgi:hypothetical protein